MTLILDLTNRYPAQDGETVHREPQGDTQYNIILTYEYFSRLEPADVYDTARGLFELLAPGGELHIKEPSAEFTAREILYNRLTIPLSMHIYGSKHAPNRTAFTLVALRQMVEQLGMTPAFATTEPYIVATGTDGSEHLADRHHVVAIKPGGGKQWLTT